MSNRASNTTDELWKVADYCSDLIGPKVYERLGMTLTWEEIHNVTHSIYVELCRAKNARD